MKEQPGGSYLSLGLGVEAEQKTASLSPTRSKKLTYTSSETEPNCTQPRNNSAHNPTKNAACHY